MRLEGRRFVSRPVPNEANWAFTQLIRPRSGSPARDQKRPDRISTMSTSFALGSITLLSLGLALPAFGQGAISTVAGNGTQGYTLGGASKVATSAELSNPEGVAVDSSGNLYIADYLNNVIRKVDTSGTITTVAGNGTSGYRPADDGQAAIGAELSQPTDVAVDGNGDLYIADYGNNRIRKVDTTGIITTVAGNGTAGYLVTDDGGAAIAAELDGPWGVAVDSSGNLYIADYGNSRIRKVDTSSTITTVAGNGNFGYRTADEGVLATNAELNYPTGVAIDGSGNLYIADYFNNVVRKVDASRKITTVAGNNTKGYFGDWGPASSAELNRPTFVAVDTSGNLFISDAGNNRIRKVNAAGMISTVGGNGVAGYDGDGGAATFSELSFPSGVAVDNVGNLYIGDTTNQRIRKSAVLVPILSSEMDAAANWNAVFYLCYDSNLYRLADSWGGWFFIQVTGVNGVPPVAASTGIATYVNTFINSTEVFYTADSGGQLHIEQLWGPGLVPADVTKGVGKPVAPGSNLVGYIDPIANTDNVFYIGTDRRVHVLTWSPLAGVWKEDAFLDNIIEKPADMGSPLSGHIAANNRQEIFYIGVDQHVYDLWRSSVAFNGWHSIDVTLTSGVEPAPGSPLVGFYDPVAGVDAMFLVANVGTYSYSDVFELQQVSSAPWKPAVDLTPGLPYGANLGSALAAHLNTAANLEEVFFLDRNLNVEELSAPFAAPNQWVLSNPTALTGAVQADPETALTADMDTQDHTDRIFYISLTSEDVHDLWSNGLWNQGNTDNVTTKPNPFAPVAVP